MKELDFRAVLKDFQYKPNFSIGVYESAGRWRLRIVMYVENSREPLRPWVIDPLPQEEFYSDFRRVVLPPATHIGYSPSRPLIEVMGNFTIPPYFMEGDDDKFMDWLVTSIRGMEDHEIFEWLRYKGELINDPHQEA